jgi:hypothetical protein
MNMRSKWMKQSTIQVETHFETQVIVMNANRFSITYFIWQQ